MGRYSAIDSVIFRLACKSEGYTGNWYGTCMGAIADFESIGGSIHQQLSLLDSNSSKARDKDGITSADDILSLLVTESKQRDSSTARVGWDCF